jgi:hypothetical protein
MAGLQDARDILSRASSAEEPAIATPHQNAEVRPLAEIASPHEVHARNAFF